MSDEQPEDPAEREAEKKQEAEKKRAAPEAEGEQPAPASEDEAQAAPEPEAPNPTTNASDPANARKLDQDARAMENAIAALMGVRGGISNVFVANTIGLVDAGPPRAGGAYHGSLPTGPVPRRAISAVVETFVEPDGYRGLRERLRDQHLVLLRAPAGWGRTATALALLSAECAEGVAKLSPDTDLRSPSAPVDLAGDHGYLLETLEPDQAAALTEFALNLWRRRLADAKARMIVLVGTGTPLRERELADYLVDGAPREDDRALVLSHFRAGLRAAGRASGDLTGFPEFADLVEEVVGRAMRAQDLADFGRGLCAVVLGERVVEDVRLQYARSAEAAFREWFDSLPDNEHRAFAIALATLDGMPLATVAEASTTLATFIQAAEVPDQRDRTRDVFAVRTLRLVERVEAELTSVVEDSDLGSLTTEVVRYRDPHRPRKVLQHVWREYTEAHGVVRDWLCELGSSPDRQVRIRAGVAVGLLSLSEFDHARRHVIERWADENQYWERQAVIGALRLPAMQPELQPLIARMIDRWLPGKAATGRRVAAVAALGTLPIMTTDQVLKRLRKAADTDQWRMVIAIADSITTLSLELDRLNLVLAALLRWSASHRVELRNTALNCVLQLTAYLQVFEEGSTDPWPGLLWVADLDRREEEPEHPVVAGGRGMSRREAVVTLIARALNAQHFVPEAIKVVHRWVRTAQRDATQREPLGALLVEVAAATGDPTTLRFYLTDWARTRRGPAEAATALLAALNHQEDRP
ncbi:hypothetical protein JOF41_000094 [Saccharothrix coeruleofusca]|uniref:hypothetical protein n=1 Tax=Saccharothrix coeruleofusca TaxID=33919 RepID=UPI001AE21954|nr:hypothetical protein [Saccharothrix coeruleofusca]MBP2333916.1 hypothetical protein [Saccharothrix coeruleofusca]